MIVSASDDKTIKIWDRTSKDCVHTFYDPGGWVFLYNDVTVMFLPLKNKIHIVAPLCNILDIYILLKIFLLSPVE